MENTDFKKASSIIQASTDFDLVGINSIYIYIMIVPYTFFKEGPLQGMDNICLIIKKVLILCCSYHSICHRGLVYSTLFKFYSKDKNTYFSFSLLL